MSFENTPATESSDLFPADLRANWFAARHELGLYHSCGVTSSYTYKSANRSHDSAQHRVSVRTRIANALHQTLTQQPLLCYGLLPPSTTVNTGFFKRLPLIHFNDVVEFYHHGYQNAGTNSSSISEEEREQQTTSEIADISTHISSAHNHLFTSQTRIPCWKVTVHTYERAADECGVYILFMLHHSLADGLGAAAFQTSLHSYLSSFAGSDSSEEGLEMGDKEDEFQWPYIVPTDIPNPVSYAIENMMDIDGSHPESPAKEENAKSNPEENIWEGNPVVSTRLLEPYICRSAIHLIPSSHMSSIINTCHALGLTLTGYLHGLIISHLSRTLSSSNPSTPPLSFKSVTPYSIRSLTNYPITSLGGNHVSWTITHFPPSIINSMCSTQEESKEEFELIAKCGKLVKKELETGMEDLKMGKGLSTVRDLRERQKEEGGWTGWTERTAEMGTRGASYEISNLGVVRVQEQKQEQNQQQKQEKMKLNNLIFSQSGISAGTPIECSVVSLKGGPLVLCLNWQQGVVEDVVVEGLGRFLERRLCGVVDTVVVG